MAIKPNDSNLYVNLAIMSLAFAVACAAIWLWDEYVASYFTIIFPGISLAILLIAGIADWIEPSRIPRWYYGLMVIAILIPLLVGALFYYIYQGRLEWLQPL